MKTSDILVGAKYSNPTEKYGGVRIVDAIFERRSGQKALSWTNAQSKEASSGHDRGVSRLATFARWARLRESMSEHEIQAHMRRAAQHAEMVAEYGPVISAWMDSQDRLRPSS